jgi:hypothetical protein
MKPAIKLFDVLLLLIFVRQAEAQNKTTDRCFLEIDIKRTRKNKPHETK